MHVLRRVTKPGFQEYGVREIILSPRSKTYKRSRKIAVLSNPFYYLLFKVLLHGHNLMKTPGKRREF